MFPCARDCRPRLEGLGARGRRADGQTRKKNATAERIPFGGCEDGFPQPAKGGTHSTLHVVEWHWQALRMPNKGKRTSVSRDDTGIGRARGSPRMLRGTGTSVTQKGRSDAFRGEVLDNGRMVPEGHCRLFPPRRMLAAGIAPAVPLENWRHPPVPSGPSSRVLAPVAPLRLVPLQQSSSTNFDHLWDPLSASFACSSGRLVLRCSLAAVPARTRAHE
jgi:hypothetical protein